MADASLGFGTRPPIGPPDPVAASPFAFTGAVPAAAAIPAQQAAAPPAPMPGPLPTALPQQYASQLPQQSQPQLQQQTPINWRWNPELQRLLAAQKLLDQNSNLRFLLGL